MLLSSHLSTAQIKTSIKYSADIEHRINTAKQIAQQVKQFRKDSSKLVKEKYNQLKHTTDSLVKHRKQQLSPDKLTSNSQELQELTSVQQQAGALVDQKYTQVGKYKKISKKELQLLCVCPHRKSP